MTLQKLYDFLPEELRVTPESLPPGIASAIDFLIARDALIEEGTSPVALPTIEEWRAGHGG